MEILIKSAKIVDSSNSVVHLKKRDILIKNGVILQIGNKIEPSSKAKVISKDNLHVSLGWFDSSVCFGEPGNEERETILNGLETAAKSGFTDVVLNTNSNPTIDNSATLSFLKNSSAEHAVNLHPLGSLTMKAEGNDLSEMFDMQSAGAVGFYDYKHAISNSNLIKIALQYAQNFDALVYSFPIDIKIAGKGIVNEGVEATKLGLKGIPALSEELQITRDLFILEYTGGKLHIPTISTAKSVKLVDAAKKKGLDVSCSVAVHNLMYTDEVLKDFDTNYKVMPPLRTSKDVKALIKGVKEGIIDFVTSDHTPMNIENKRVEFDNADYGTIGLESAFGALNSIFGLETTIKILTKGKDRYKIAPSFLKEGGKATLTLFNPDKEYSFSLENVHSTSRNSMYFNTKLKGEVYGIISGEKTII